MFRLLAVLSLSGALTWSACDASRERESVATAPRIDQRAATQLALRRYRELFEDKYFFNPADLKHNPMPAMTEQDIDRVEEAANAWLVVADPLAGLALEAHVAKDGSWTELVYVRWVAE